MPWLQQQHFVAGLFIQACTKPRVLFNNNTENQGVTGLRLEQNVGVDRNAPSGRQQSPQSVPLHLTFVRSVKSGGHTSLGPSATAISFRPMSGSTPCSFLEPVSRGWLEHWPSTVTVRTVGAGIVGKMMSNDGSSSTGVAVGAIKPSVGNSVMVTCASHVVGHSAEPQGNKHDWSEPLAACLIRNMCASPGKVATLPPYIVCL